MSYDVARNFYQCSAKYETNQEGRFVAVRCEKDMRHGQRTNAPDFQHYHRALLPRGGKVTWPGDGVPCPEYERIWEEAEKKRRASRHAPWGKA